MFKHSSVVMACGEDEATSPLATAWLQLRDATLTIRRISHSKERMTSSSFPGDQPDQRSIFELNVQELKACDLVLAIVDGPDVDSGVAYELGYVCARASLLSP